MKRFIYIIISIFYYIYFSYASDTTKVLFIGNSYTYVNELPVLFQNLSRAGNKYVFTDIYAQGGYSLENHKNDSASINKIRSRTWSYVVLQEQSQIPTIDYYRFNSMYPSSVYLDSVINVNGAATIFYETWGRRYGGQQCIDNYCSPVFVNYYHMQDSLKSAYTEISNMLSAKVSLVGEAWRKAHSIDSTLDLWDTDLSHPTLMGSYLAACVFYITIFEQSPVGLPYYGGLKDTLALYLQNIAWESVIGIKPNSNIIPGKIHLYQNYPNPFNPITIIRFTVPRSRGARGVTDITLKIYDLLGREVADITPPFKEGREGLYEVEWNASRFPSGIYFYQLTSGDYTESKKMILVK